MATINEIEFIVIDNNGNEKVISEKNLNLWELHEDFSYNKDLPIRILVNGKEIKA